jgi:predicted DNA-binding transcriptional regulator YafY
MPRNAEVIRQWTILRDLESSRRLTIDDLAASTGVTTRTIRRDLEALQASGFPLYDDVEDGKRYWKLEQKAFRRLDDTAFTLGELSALYFSRALMEGLASSPFQRDLRGAFDKLSGALSPGMRQFLDRLPRVVQGKAEAGLRGPGSPAGGDSDAVRAARVARLVEASLEHRRVSMQYRSLSRDAEKDYLIEPYRLLLARGTLYVVAFVPEYGQLRTFAVDRIVNLSVTEERFVPQDFPEELFDDSLGVNQGTPPQTIEIEFEGRVARYVRGRTWHPSQTVAEREDGRIVLTLQVSNDWALRSWILGFGSRARVLAPPELAAQILDDLEQARGKYSE